MKKEDLSKNLKAINAKIATVEGIEIPDYKTATKFIPNIGYVAEISTLRECAKALSKINKQFKSEIDSANELGIDESDIVADTNYLGYKKEVWVSDLQKRVSELKNEELLIKLNKAKSTLMKHRSEEDIFNEDMDEISDILNTL